MKPFAEMVKAQAPRIAALAVCAGLYWAASLPALSHAERAGLVGRFRFDEHRLPKLPGPPERAIRAVHPSLQQHSAWISAVGAAVALNDLDGNGLPDDVCYVDPRTDRVIIAPAPGTGSRYSPFVLAPAALPYHAATTAPMGALPGDFNEDGRTDVLVYYWGRTPVLFLRSGGARPERWSFVEQELVAGGARWFTNAATAADLDGDGHADLVFGNYFPDGARILDAHAGGLEVMQASMSRAFNGGTKHFLLWDSAEGERRPSVRYRPITPALDSAVLRSWTLAVGAADLDGDLLPELYYANDFGPDRLLHNLSTPGRLSFRLLEGARAPQMPRSKVLGHDSFKGMGVDFKDVNADGRLDIFVSNIATSYGLQESNFLFTSTGSAGAMQKGRAPYSDESERLGVARSGWAWEAKLDDFDNDGVVEAIQPTGFVRGSVNRWPELQELATGNDAVLHDPRVWPRVQPGDDLDGHQHLAFYSRSRSGRYFDIAPRVGLDARRVGRGVATADVDGDGRLDFAVANQWDDSYLYRNAAPGGQPALALHLLLPVGSTGGGVVRVTEGYRYPAHASTPAIGAEARVRLPGGQILVSQVDGGNGHSGKRSADLHFGLGQVPAATPVSVTLRWRDRSGESHEHTLELRSGWHTVVLGA